MPDKVNESLDDFVNDSLEIVAKASEKGVELRILGALSCYLHLKEVGADAVSTYLGMDRLGKSAMFTDLDLIGYKKQRGAIIRVLEKELRLTPDLRFMAYYGHDRLLFYKDDKFSIDVFLDELRYSHNVNFKGRLELDYPAITVTDLLLEKLQIHQINRKDLVDLIAVFLYYPISTVEIGNSQKAVDAEYVSTILSDDWGFWYDATSNLGKVLEMALALKGEGKLTDGQMATVRSKVAALTEHIDKKAKTRSWTERAKVGTRKPWYRDVEEVVR